MKYSCISLILLLLLPLSLWSQEEQAAQEEDKNSRERKGPANITFNIMEKVEADHDFNDEHLFSINEQVFRDANRESGYYYYYPTEYSLNWIANRGDDPYDLNFNYGQDGQVTVTAILKPKISSQDIRLFRSKLLAQATTGKADASPAIVGFQPLPLRNRPEIEFNNLSQFGISEDQVDVRPPADLKGDILLSFTTESIESLINMLFNDIGLYGNVIISPSGKNVQQEIAIPFNLKIDDPATYGRMILQGASWRRGWTNRTGYPVKLNYLHMLKEENDHHQVYSWKLGDAEVPEEASIDFQNAYIIPNSWDNDRSIKRIWLDYTMQPCTSCNEKLRESFEKGNGKDRMSIKVRIQDVLEFTGADVAYLKIRSLQADPNGRRKVALEDVEITSDGMSVDRGPLYLDANGDFNFEYQISLVMPDGKVHQARTWISHNQSILSLGSSQVKKQILFFRSKPGGSKANPAKKASPPMRRNGNSSKNKLRRNG
ncbi:MAG: hypothetical protein R8P61_32400 [Bacteroidia bacterium]|nr:hypothetical protein [Bacteroidia bacterium]